MTCADMKAQDRLRRRVINVMASIMPVSSEPQLSQTWSFWFVNTHNQTCCCFLGNLVVAGARISMKTARSIKMHGSGPRWFRQCWAYVQILGILA